MQYLSWVWTRVNQNLYTPSVAPQKGKNTKINQGGVKLGKIYWTIVKFSFSLAMYS